MNTVTLLLLEINVFIELCKNGVNRTLHMYFIFLLRGIPGSRRRVRFGDPGTPGSRTTTVNYLNDREGAPLSCEGLRIQLLKVLESYFSFYF